MRIVKPIGWMIVCLGLSGCSEGVKQGIYQGIYEGARLESKKGMTPAERATRPDPDYDRYSRERDILLEQGARE